MTATTRWIATHRRRLTVVGWLTGLVLIVVVPVWPGVFTIDSQAMLSHGLANQVSNWYAPIHGWIWARIDDLGAPTGFMLLAATTGFVVSAYLFLRLWLAETASLVAVSAVVVWPPVYGMLGWVGRDVWFTVYVVLAFALAGRARRGVAVRWTGGGALVCAVLALDTRQNAFPLLIVVAGLVAWTFASEGAWVARLRQGGIVVGVAVVGFVVATALQGVVVSERHYPIQHLYAYDLMAMTIDRGEILIPEDLFPSQDLEVARAAKQPGRILFAGVYHHHEDGSTSLDGQVIEIDTAPGAGDLNARYEELWWNAVIDDPASYLRVRTGLYLDQAAITVGALSPYYGITDELYWERSGDLRQRLPWLSDLRLRYLEGTSGVPGQGSLLHAVWIYLLLGIGGSVLVIKRGGRLRPLGYAAVGLVGLSQVILFFTAPVANYRYQFPIVVFGILMAIAGASFVLTSPTDREAEPSGDPSIRGGRRSRVGSCRA